MKWRALVYLKQLLRSDLWLMNRLRRGSSWMRGWGKLGSRNKSEDWGLRTEILISSKIKGKSTDRTRPVRTFSFYFWSVSDWSKVGHWMPPYLRPFELLSLFQSFHPRPIEVNTPVPFACHSAVGCSTPVSYTHLRAHETVLDLVCRLLLEKKKKRKNIKQKKTCTLHQPVNTA